MIVLTIVLILLAVTALSGAIAAVRARSKKKGAVTPPASRPAAAPAPVAPAPASTTSPSAPPAEAVDEAIEVGEVDAVAGEVPPAPLEEEPEERAPEYKERLGRSRGLFASLRARVGRGKVDAEVIEDLEAALLGADVGVSTTDHLLEMVTTKAAAGELEDTSDLLGALRSELLAILSTGTDGPVDRSLRHGAAAGRVPVWLFVGVNGVGKTTTIGKLSARETQGGRKVLLAAGDTFRAAAADQLSMWAERTGAEVVRGAEGGDPSSVVFDAIQRAGARNADLVLADTAGRLHTKVNLVEELKKVRRVADKEPGEVVEVLLVLDATTGQNAVSQAREFMDAVDATGVVLTKLDGTARGGVVIAIQRELGLPVKLVGLGEGAADLVDFDPESFVDALLEP